MNSFIFVFLLSFILASCTANEAYRAGALVAAQGAQGFDTYEEPRESEAGEMPRISIQSPAANARVLDNKISLSGSCSGENGRIQIFQGDQLVARTYCVGKLWNSPTISVENLAPGRFQLYARINLGAERTASVSRTFEK